MVTIYYLGGLLKTPANVLKSIYLWIIKKRTEMKNAKEYSKAIECQDTIFNLMNDYITDFNKDEEVKGYVSIKKVNQNRIDLQMGSQNFSIISDIKIGGDILFNVYMWKFSLSSLTGYTEQKIDVLTFIKNGDSLMWSSDQKGYDNKKYSCILMINEKPKKEAFEIFFDQFEIFIDNPKIVVDLSNDNKA